jgi:stearoyl-CoA desaturase (delta-9 desaturase)
MCQTTAQKSVIWWASKHRHHHLHSDTEHDVHSPRHHGFIYSHLGWIFARKHTDPDFAKVADLTRYPELMWLHKVEVLPAVVLADSAIWLAGRVSSSGSCGARCSSTTARSASIRSPM